MKTICDNVAAHELVLYIINDRITYENMTIPTIKNLQKKLANGKYNKEKAPDAWKYVAEYAAKRYAKEFATPAAWCAIFNAATRRAAAMELMQYYDINEY